MKKSVKAAWSAAGITDPALPADVIASSPPASRTSRYGTKRLGD
ncbi:hypothetical protein [Saccharothrix syringae]|nr:hypothetical protein [Saccharothrix syringae]